MTHLMVLAILLLTIPAAIWWARLRSSRQALSRDSTQHRIGVTPHNPVFPGPDSASSEVGRDLRGYAELVGRAAWGTREHARSIDLVLEPEAVYNLHSNERIISIILGHVRTVAPGLPVP